MLIIQTEYANFGNPTDLLKYMIEENIKVVHVTAKYCFTTFVNNLEMTVYDVKNWIKGDIK